MYVTVLATALAMAACGASDDGATESVLTTEATENGEQDSTAGDGTVGGTDQGAPAAGELSATATIGGTTYEFSPGAFGYCAINEDGLFVASLVNEDSTVIEVSLPPEGFEAESVHQLSDEYPSVVVVVPEGARWEADAYESDPESTNNRNIPEGQTQVDSYEFDSSGASGQATFLDMESLTYNEDDSFYSGEPVSGDFQISCG